MVILLYLYFYPLDLTSISLIARLTLSGGRIILECVLYSSSSRLSRKSHFFFFLPSLFSHIFPSYPPSSPTSLYSFSLSLPHSHSTHHPPTYRCSLSFVSFSPCENYPPPLLSLYCSILLSIIIAFFFFFT